MPNAASRRPKHDVAFYMPWMGPLLVSGSDAPPGGAETQVLLLAKELARRGRRVAIATYAVDRPLPEEVDGVSIVVQPRYRERGGRIARLLGYLWATVATLVRLDATTLVQRAAGTPTALVALAARLRRRRFVYSSANVIDFEYERLEPRRRNVALFHLGVRLAHEIVVQTPEQVTLCERTFGRTPVMIKSLAERAELRADAEAFIWIGRLAHYKRPEKMLELARAVPEARFWMVAVPAGGTGGEMLEELGRAATDVPNLELLEPRPRAELGELLDRAVAVVNTADYEGMPNIFLEGWARGVPALAYLHDPDGVIHRERVGGFAEGVDARLADLARGMWEQRHDQADVSARCRAYIEREHSIGAVTARWEEVLCGGAG